jgi:hydroxyacylglutathione hydrolase
MTIRREIGLLGTNCYFHVYQGPGGEQRAMVIDPAQDGRALAERLSERGIEPAGIVFTHGHLDHTAGALEFVEYYRERGIELRCAIHAQDAAFLGESGYQKNRDLFRALGDEELFTSIYRPLPKADILLKDGDAVLDSGLRVIHTPGHTRGSICLVSDAERLAYSGDTLFLLGVGRTDSEDGDEAALAASLRRLFEELPEDYECFPGHGSKTTLKAERLVLFG